MARGLSESDRLARLGDLAREYPANVSPEPAGSLAGPAAPDRPPVPVWMYLEYAAQDPELSEGDIARIRFPLELHDGTLMVTSVSEMLVTPRTRERSFSVAVVDVVRLYRMMHDVGALAWDAETRTHKEVMAPEEYRDAVYSAWRESLQRPQG